MDRKFLVSALMTIGLSSLAVNANAAGSFGTNLIANPGAELGPGSPSGGAVASVPDWSLTSNFTVGQYLASSAFPTLSDPGPVDRGNNFFAGGDSNSFSSAEQQLDITFASNAVNGTGALFSLSGWLGGFASQGDNAVLQAHFLNGVGADLGMASIGPVTNVDRANATGLQFREATGEIPIGTETVHFTLNMSRLAGSYNDGYADNLSFVLSPVPEPETYAMFMAGLGLMGFLARRRKQKEATSD